LKYGETSTFINITCKAQPSKSSGVICNMNDAAIIITSQETLMLEEKTRIEELRRRISAIMEHL
jgi:hypothetical protein